MILGLGMDIVENHRIQRLYDRYGEKFLQNVFSPGEISYCLAHRDPVPYIAARFAAKEAAIKALNIKGTSGYRLQDIEVEGDWFGKKILVFRGTVLIRAQKMGVNFNHVTLSHTREYSAATVILEGASDAVPMLPAGEQF